MDSYNTPIVSDDSNIRLLKRLANFHEIRPGCVDRYRELHLGDTLIIRNLLLKHHLRNYSVFLGRIDERWFAVHSCEYAGRDFDADMAALNQDIQYREWMEICKTMHVQTSEIQSPGQMVQIFHNS
jgi:L-rhamnose mutarotase